MESFHDPVYLQDHILDKVIVLEYFSGSKWFDTNSVNSLQQQGKATPKNMDGIYYEVIYANASARNETTSQRNLLSTYLLPNTDGLFVIQKSQRLNNVLTPMECYYCLAGVIYPAPMFSELIFSRLAVASESLSNSLDICEKMVQWSLVTGFLWRAPVVSSEVTPRAMPHAMQDSEHDHPNGNMHTTTDVADGATIGTNTDTQAESKTNRAQEVEYIPLSMRKLRMIEQPGEKQVTVVFDQPEPIHLKTVLETEYSRLFQVNKKIAATFATLTEKQQEEETQFRGVFEKIFSNIAEVQEEVRNERNKMSKLPLWLSEKEADGG